MATKKLESVECVGVEKRPNKHHVFVLIVVWSDGTKFPIHRKYSSFFDFLALLKEQVTNKCALPELPSYTKLRVSGFVVDKFTKRQKIIQEFCQQILRLPPEILNSNTVISFFDCWEQDKSIVQSSDLSLNPRSSPRLSRKAQEILGLSNKKIHGSPSMLQEKSTSCANFHVPTPVPRRHSDGSEPPDNKQNEVEMGDTEEPKYTAIFSYKRRKSSEVNLSEGTIVHVFEKSTTGWWFVSVQETEEEGWAPGAFLEPMAELIKEESDEEDDGEIIGRCRAMSDFKAEVEDEVSCRQGEEVEVLTTSMDGWWKVRCNGSSGYVPATYLQELNVNSLSKSPEKVNMLKDAMMNQQSIYGKRSPPPRRSTVRRNKNKFTYENTAGQYPASPKVTKAPRGHVKTPSGGNRVQYTQVVFSDEEEDDKSALYAKVNKKNKTNPKFEIKRTDTAVQYAEIVPAGQQKSDVNHNGAKNDRKRPQPRPGHHSPQSPKTDTGSNVYINISPSNSYVNVELKDEKPKVAEKLYRVTKDYTPNTHHIQGIAVKENNIVQVEKEDSTLSYCIVCVENNSEAPKEGWIPTNILEKYNIKPSDIANSRFSIPLLNHLPRAEHIKEEQETNKLAPPMPQSQIMLCNHPDPPASRSPKLQDRQERQLRDVAEVSVPILAKCSYTSVDHGTLSFQKGDFGFLLQTNPLGWWLVNIGGLEGWVPGDYWKTVERQAIRPKALTKSDDESRSDDSKQPWFFGKIARHECESLLIRNGEDKAFMIRESKNRIGDCTLSVRFESKVRHFPIRTTESGKFFIGNHQYESLVEIVKYYVKFTLFHTESGVAVSLGKPLKGH